MIIVFERDDSFNNDRMNSTMFGGLKKSWYVFLQLFDENHFVLF